MAGLSLDIPEGEIRNAIAVAVADAFGPEKRDALLRDIVRAHMTYRENSYDKETLFSKRVGAQVREIASEVAAKQIEALRPEIEAIVAESMGPQFKEAVYTQVRDALRRVATANMRFNVVFDQE